MRKAPTKIKSRTAIYREHKIVVTREPCLGGWSQTYFSIFRLHDNYECLSNFDDGDETLDQVVRQLKECIDCELASDDPWGERADNARDGVEG